MALHTLGTTTTTILNCTPGWSQVLSPADVAAIGQSITNDDNFATVLASGQVGPQGILTTASTHGTTTLDTIVSIAGAGLGTIMVTDLVLGAGIAPGTFVAAILSPTSVQLSQAATGNAAGVRVAFIRQTADVESGLTYEGLLLYPGGRGSLRLLAGDVVAIDNTGWPIVVSSAAIAYAGSQWVFT